MLLIWDIHITSRFKDKIIENLRDFVEKHKDDKHIVFLGDYVYHFSYDRNALLALYKFFVELFEQWKYVYVLAGNHDRLGDSFVFEEAQKAFGIFDKYSSNHPWKLKFITKPELEIIEWKKILFFPFAIQKLEVFEGDQKPAWLEEIAYLTESNNKNEQQSRNINACLARYIDENSDLLVIHHYYFQNTKFPGQKALFYYKDIALSPKLLDMQNLQMISGHLHQWFSYKNYLCTGSVWSTSSLESNQQKYIFDYNILKNQFVATQISINPYIQISATEQLNQIEIQNQISNIVLANQSNFASDSRKIEFKNDLVDSYNNISLSLQVDEIDYDQIDQYITEELRNQLKDVKLKKMSVAKDKDLLEQLRVSSWDLSSFADRKIILKSYLVQKFGDDYGDYEKMLQEMKVL